MTQHIHDTILKGGAGMLGSVLAAVSATQENAAWALGILIGICSLTSIVTDYIYKIKDRRKRDRKP